MQKFVSWLTVYFICFNFMIGFARGAPKNDAALIQGEHEMVMNWMSRHMTTRPAPFFRFYMMGKNLPLSCQIGKLILPKR
jgi:hypothetical protein